MPNTSLRTFDYIHLLDRKGVRVRVPATTTNELWRTPQHAYQTTCMDPKSVESSSKTKTTPISKTERHLFRWAQAQVASFPKREKLTGKPLGRLDSSTWTKFVREYPNPTIFTDTNLARPQDKSVSEFHCTFSRVAFLDYTLFWHHIYPKIVCPKCKSCEHTTLDGWGDTLRRAASKEGTIYLYYRKYACSKCGDFNACDSYTIVYHRRIIHITMSSRRCSVG